MSNLRSIYKYLVETQKVWNLCLRFSTIYNCDSEFSCRPQLNFRLGSWINREGSCYSSPLTQNTCSTVSQNLLQSIIKPAQPYSLQYILIITSIKILNSWSDKGIFAIFNPSLNCVCVMEPLLKLSKSLKNSLILILNSLTLLCNLEMRSSRSLGLLLRMKLGYLCLGRKVLNESQCFFTMSTPLKICDTLIEDVDVPAKLVVIDFVLISIVHIFSENKIQ